MSQDDRIPQSIQSLLEFEVKTPSRTMVEVSTLGQKDLESLIRGFLDYFDPGTEQSVLTNLNLQELRDEEFQLIVPDWDDRITKSPKNYIIFYDEVLRSELRFSLHLFLSNVLDFYRLHPTQVTPNAIRMIIVFIICCRFSIIELRIPLFLALFILKKHPYEKG